MRKRIMGSVLSVALLAIVLLTFFLTLQFYRLFANQVQNELKNKTVLLEGGLNYETDNLGYLSKLSIGDTNIRVSYMDAEGWVLFDSEADVEGMENHESRPEVRAALADGRGESRRFSDTLGKETIYYAVRLNDGTILRVAKTTDNVYGVFVKSLPVVLIAVLLVMLLVNRISGRLTDYIIKPIKEVDLEDGDMVTYDELSPFIRKIAHQNERIHSQIEDIESKENTIEAITENMKEGFALIDHKGKVLYLNKSGKRLFGVGGEASFAGRDIAELTRDVEVLKYARGALEGEGADVVLERGGKAYEGIFSPVRNEGALLLFLDVTQRVKAEKLRREFTANVSHELRTPLTTISGYAELIYNGMVKDGDVNEFAGKVKEESSRLISLIEDVILLSSLDEAADLEDEKEVAVAKLIGEVANALGMRARERQVTLTVAVGDERIVAKESMLYELIYNLVDNGVKYNKPNGSVDVEASKQGEALTIRVRDTGIGIANEHLDRVFERFYRVDKSRSKKTGGTGLGLSIVKHAVQAMDGTVDIESKVNEGTTVTVKLRLPHTAPT